MIDRDHQYHIAETADGKFVAYSTRAPYFCFVKDSEEEAIAIADGALELCERIDIGSFHPKSVSHTVTELTPTRTIHRESSLVA